MKSAVDAERTRASTGHLNRLRAAVLGANDGIVSISSLVVGVAGATPDHGTILTAGIAGLVAGAFSMALGEYVSVSSQRDTERAYIANEKRRLRDYPEEEFEELAGLYQHKGLSADTAHRVATELTKKDPIKAHLEAELGLDENDLNDPWQAAGASLVAFTFGGMIPLLAMLGGGPSSRVPLTFVAAMVALTLTGYLSATAGGASRRRAVARVVFGGVAAMVITYLAGYAFGTAIR